MLIRNAVKRLLGNLLSIHIFHCFMTSISPTVAGVIFLNSESGSLNISSRHDIRSAPYSHCIYMFVPPTKCKGEQVIFPQVESFWQCHVNKDAFTNYKGSPLAARVSPETSRRRWEKEVEINCLMILLAA